jgi:hypothetical protein
MSSIPSGEGLSQLSLIDRLKLARQELSKQGKLRFEWDESKGGRLPDEVLDSVAERYGLLGLTDEETNEIKIYDLTRKVEALAERGRQILGK